MREALVQARIATPLGDMVALLGEDGVHLLDFADRKGLEARIIARARGRSVLPGASGPGLSALERALEAYFTDRSFHLSVGLAEGPGTPFQKAVWRALAGIAPGRTLSYSALAAAIGAPGAARAAANQVRLNPWAILVPCHRVIGADGSLTGYAGGIARKSWLLRHEAAAGRGSP